MNIAVALIYRNTEYPDLVTQLDILNFDDDCVVKKEILVGEGKYQ